MPPSPRPLGCFFLVWALIWTSAVGVFDVALGWAVFHQLRAATFPTTDGVVTRSEVKTDSESHRFDVAYNYMVAGQRYTGTRYSHTDIGTNSDAWYKIRDEFPVGARVRVAYNPAAPAESMLRPGLTGFHLMMVWFLTPFNVIVVGSWVYLARSRRPAFGPHSITKTATGWRVRVTTLGRAGCFGGCLLGVTFVGSFAWAFGCGFNPPVEYAGPAYVTALALAALLARWATRPWFEVDEVSRVLRLPAEVPFDTIREVVTTHEEKRDSEGDVTQHYHCDLTRADAPPVRIASYSEPEPANALTAWLRERIGIAPASG